MQETYKLWYLNWSNSCPTCIQGQKMSHGKNSIGAILCHIHDNTLVSEHGDTISYSFVHVAESSFENLEIWVQNIGVPEYRVPTLMTLPKESLIYLFNCGMDPNILFTSQIIDMDVSGISIVEKIKIFLIYGYRFGSYQNENYHILDLIEDISMFVEALELFTFTTEDAKCYIEKHLQKSIIGKQWNLPQILHLTKLFDLQEYIRSRPVVSNVLKFNQMID